jgi:desulfoferrodoxin (superoxide reductase-like protein)
MAQAFSLLGLQPSFGFGDRTGLATPGHAQSIMQYGQGIMPIFCQQSIREMTRTNRSAEEVAAAAIKGTREVNWTKPQGADADHLKTEQDIERTAQAGFSFFTLDPSPDVDQHADNDDEQTLRQKWEKVAAEISWIEAYRGKKIELPNGLRIDLNDAVIMKAGVKYGRAVNTAVRLGKHVAVVTQKLGQVHEIEMSVDETEHPTSLEEHYLIASYCLSQGVKLVSLAPRFVGDFEKGIDFKGSIAEFEASLAGHVAIADHLGPYKISLHSGSDKLSIYETFARTTKGRFHVKTAGTSYLEALRVVARHDENLFRKIVTFSRERFPTDKQSYHVSVEVEKVPSSDQVKELHELESLYLEHWSDVPAGKGFTQLGRQILHCTFGSVLTHPEFAPAIAQLLKTYQSTYTEILVEHFGRHLQALNAGLN